MKTLSYSIASLLVLFTVTIPVTLTAQGPAPTVATAFSIENTAGAQVTLDIPNTGVTPWTLFFPSSAPTPGSLFTGVTAGGTTDWLAAGAAGTVLQIGTSGLPEWSLINTLPNGSGTNTILVWNGSQWVSNPNFSSDPANGNTTVGGDLTVSTGGDVILPNGVIDNSELANSSFNVSYGTGLSGDASVALGGTLNLNNTGVTDVAAGSGINVSGTTGSVTISNTGLLGATAGAGIGVSTTAGNVTITNTGVTQVSGTTNQINVSPVGGTGSVTLSTPQDIHTGAAPTFAGLTLTGLTSGADPYQVVVRNTTDNSLETRAINVLPNGTGTNTTLIWNGTNWVENTNVTMTPGGNITTAGDLTVNGTSVTVPNGSIDNNELANSSVTVNTGTGLSGGGPVALGSAITLTNTGVTGVSAGSGISVSGSTGNVTISNTGVTQVSGTTNQINVSPVGGTGNVTLSTPQNIHTGASPTFAGMTLTGLATGTSSQVLIRNTTTNALETRTIQTLPSGTGTNTTLIWNGTNWVENTNVTMTPGGNITTAGNLTVNGTSVTVPNGSIDNNELANSSVTVTAGTGLSGGGPVSLGGSVTLNNAGVTGVSAGSGISVSGSTGNVTISNTGVTQVSGTTNQINVSPVGGTGSVTLSTPQNIHTGASPTFSGMTLSGLSTGSTATNIVVSNGGTLQTRTIGSLIGGSGRVSTASATNTGGSWRMTISDATITASNAVLVTYEDPAGGASRTALVSSRTAGTSFQVQFSGMPASGSFVNYYVLP